MLKKKIESLHFLYNHDEKIEFLNKINESSPRQTTLLNISVLKKIDKAESLNGREWIYFTEDMVDAAIIEFRSTSIIVLQTYISIIKDYLISVAPATDTMLVGYAYTISLDKEKLIAPEKGYINNIGKRMQFITQQELDDIVLKRKGDASSKCLYILLFNGIRGDNFTDLLSIKNEDIDVANGIVKLPNNIYYAIPDKYIDIFKQALETEEYTEYDYKGNLVFANNFEAGEYFFKRTVARNSGYKGEPIITLHIMSKRINGIGKSGGNPYLTATSIYNSGLTYRLLETTGFIEPTYTQLEEYKKALDVKLSYTSMKTISDVLLAKIGKTPN